MPNERIEIDVELSGAKEAEKQLTEVAGAAEEVETHDDIKIRLEAQFDDAKRQAKELKDQLEALDRQQVTPEVDTQPVRDFTDDTGKAKDAMHGFVGEAITELPGVGQALGPAGEAVGQLTEGILAGEVAMTSLVTAALPIAGIVVAVQAITSALEQAKKVDAFKKAEVEQFKKAIGDAATTTEGLIAHFRELQKIEWVTAAGDTKDVTENLHNLNLEVEDFATFVTDDKAFETWKEQMIAADPALAALITGTGEFGTEILDAGAQLGRATTNGKDYEAVIAAIEQSQGTLKKTTQETAVANAVYGRSIDNVTTAQEFAKKATDDTKDAIDRLRGALNFETETRNLQTDLLDALNGVKDQGVQPSIEQLDALKQSIIDVGETAGLTDVEIDTQLRAVDQGDYMTVLAQVQQYSRLNPILLATALANPMFNSHPQGGGGAVPVATVAGTVVNVNLPRGTRGVDVTSPNSTRRHGRRYGNPVVSYARR